MLIQHHKPLAEQWPYLVDDMFPNTSVPYEGTITRHLGPNGTEVTSLLTFFFICTFCPELFT